MRTTEKDHSYITKIGILYNAWQAITAFLDDEDDDGSYNHVFSSRYPFEKSFDDYLTDIQTWYKTQLHKLQIAEINTVDDVREWFTLLLDKGINFHPDCDFTDYNNLTAAEADNYNATMNTAHAVCGTAGADIYGIALDVIF